MIDTFIQKDSIVQPLPSADFLSKLENYWCVTLPKDYRDFIMQYNGAILREDIAYHYEISRFLCVLENYQDHPCGCFDIDVIDAQIGERLCDDPNARGTSLLPIALLFYGNFLCLDFRKDKANPSVCIWVNEESGEFSASTYKLANNFTEFLGILTYPKNNSF